jgi:hypothetical protein
LISALLAGICGAVAAVLGKLVVRDTKGHLVQYIVVVAGLFAILGTASRSYLLPEANAWKARWDARKYLQSDPLFSALATEHPEVREKFTSMMVDLARSGAGPAVARARALEFGRSILASYIGQYAPRASSESLVAYLTTMLDVLHRLGTQDPEACFAFLFGQGTEGASALAQLTPGQKAATTASVTQVIESALRAPQEPPSPEEGQALLRQLVQSLANTHDEEFMASLGMLREPRKPGLDYKALCFATMEMYRAVMEMPEPDRTRLLRHMFGSKA